MLHRLLSGVRRSSKSLSKPSLAASTSHRPALLEPLEGRQLLSSTLRVTAISADNRGEVVLTLNRAVRAATVSASSVIIYTPGKDKKIGTGDDVRVHAAVTYDASTLKITIHGRLDLSTSGDLGYRVRVLSSKLLAGNGAALDGEFEGAGVQTGNGKAGGDLNFRVVAPAGNPTARFSTSLGVMNVQLYKSKVATTVNNFIAYVNRAFYDGTIIHRNVPGFVVQGGGYESKLDTNGLPTAIATFLPIKLQASISNTLGTIAMARSTDPNSATGEWFFNAVNNASSLDANTTTGNAGYAVFGKVTNAAGLSVLAAMNAVSTVDLTPTVANTAFETVPEVNGQFVTIRRVALIDTIAKL